VTVRLRRPETKPAATAALRKSLRYFKCCIQGPLWGLVFLAIFYVNDHSAALCGVGNTNDGSFEATAISRSYCVIDELIDQSNQVLATCDNRQVNQQHMNEN